MTKLLILLASILLFGDDLARVVDPPHDWWGLTGMAFAVMFFVIGMGDRRLKWWSS